MQPRFHGVLQLLTLQIVDHLVGRGLANIENRFPCEMLGSDLVTHRPPPDFRQRSGAASVRSASWPVGESSSAAPLQVTRAFPRVEKTSRSDGVGTARASASAPPALPELCCACTTSRSLDPVAADNRCFRANRAAQSTCGSSVDFI